MAAVPPVHRPRPFDDLVDELFSAVVSKTNVKTKNGKVAENC